MLKFVLDHRKAINKFTADKDNELRRFELSTDEWKVVEQLCDILEVLKDATLFFSRSTPNVANVIPVMDIISDRLTAHANDTTMSPAIRAALGLAKKTLNRYYSKTDTSEVYRIAMVLHPQYKLQYFKDAKWEPEWIDTAEELVRTQFDLAYHKDNNNTTENTADKNPIPKSSSKSSSKQPNLFDKLLKPSPSNETRNELDRYLATDTEDVEDPLLWWAERRSMFPALSRMALDYLSIPATSVDVERAFSRGRLLLTHVRSRLSAQSTRSLLCVGNWSLHGYIKDSDVEVAARLPDVEGDEDEELEEGWDDIVL